MALRSPAAKFSQKCLGVALLLLVLAALPARSAEFTDAAARRVVVPDYIGRVMAADRTAEVLVLVLAPDKLAGLGSEPRRSDLPPRFARVPVIRWRPDGNPANMIEPAQQLRPDVIIDASGVTPDRAAYADQVQQLTGIPYILVDDSFARMPELLRSVGTMLGVADRGADLAIWAEHAIAGLRGRLLIRPAENRPHVYYGRGASGLETALPGSPSGEAIDEAGAINVATPLGRGARVVVTAEQLFAWDPEIILAEQGSFYNALLRNRAWRRLSAVRNKRVYLEPSRPFGWIDDPPGLNRLIGLYWLSGLFYPDQTEQDLRTVTCDFYDKFYGEKLTNAQLEALVRPAGAPPPDTAHPYGEPLVGLGAAPPSSLAPPSISPQAPSSTQTPTAPQTPAPPSTPPQPTASTCGASASAGMQLRPLPPSATNPEIAPLIQEGAPTGTPGVPPPGRRGRTPGMGTPGVPTR
jgi:iron complex transport system substrate-binding protein